ncbi:MAG: hypothetical protein H0U13_14445 [Gemmatimonadaceae bacterium]|nr:hypothetical protein [Gemmatimonadaceae bacterium]
MLHKAIIGTGPLLGLVLGACSSPKQGASKPVSQLPIRLETAHLTKKPAEAIFGRPDDNGRWLRLRDVKFVEGKTFGWRIRLPCKQPVEYTEIMKLPAPGDFTFDPDELRETTVSADKKTSTTHDYAACIAGWIEHSWALAPEDPKGTWEISVAIAGYETVVWRVQFVD